MSLVPFPFMSFFSCLFLSHRNHEQNDRAYYYYKVLYGQPVVFIFSLNFFSLSSLALLSYTSVTSTTCNQAYLFYFN